MRGAVSMVVRVWLLFIAGCSGNSAPTATSSPPKPAESVLSPRPSAQQANSPPPTTSPVASTSAPLPVSQATVTPSISKLAPVPTVAPNAKPPLKSLTRGVTCNADGDRCGADKPICVIRNFARCFSEADVRREMPNSPEMPPISKDACFGNEVCPDDRPYCIWDSVTGCVDEPTAKAMIDKEEPGPQTYGVYNQCTLAKDCMQGQTCCRGFMGHGYSSCQPQCDLANTQIQCSSDADCKPLRVFCSDQACRNKIHCNGTIMGFVKVCEQEP